jgi:fructokinase
MPSDPPGAPGARPGRITCLGEALIDFLPVEQAARTVDFRMRPGGSLLNVAVGAARLGAPAALAGKLSLDFFGRYLREHLEAEGVALDWLVGVDAPCTLAFVAMERGEPTFAFYGENAADSLVTIEDLPDALFDASAILHVGSISLLRGTTPGAVVAACERQAGNALVSLDPNVRPGLVVEDPAYRALLGRLVALADLVKVSEADLAWLSPDVEPDVAARDLLAAGPELVVVTRGPGGAFAVRRGPGDGLPSEASNARTVSVPGFAVDVVDTVGAGDAFAAGFLAWLHARGAVSRARLAALTDDGLTEGLNFAAATAALTCTRAGADSPFGESVAAFLGQRDPSSHVPAGAPGHGRTVP